MNYYLSFFIISIFIVYSSQDCYNNCQNLGVCVENTCWCNDGTSGVKCPSGLDYSGNKVKECSGRGKCVKGVCQCNTGFTGLSCENFNCPYLQGKSCGGFGQCMALTSLWGTDDLDDKGKIFKNRIYGCVCGSGYSGYVCTYKECALGRFDKHALNDDGDDDHNELVNGDRIRYKDYARDIFKPKAISNNAENCTITIENCERDNKFHCKNKTILVNYKDSSKTLKKRIVGSGLLTDLIVTYVGVGDDKSLAYNFENDFKIFQEAIDAKKKDSSDVYKYSVEFYYIFDPYAKIIDDKKSTSCIDFASDSLSHKEAGKDENAVTPQYRVCSGLGGCSSDSSCTCQSAKENMYDLDTLGFGRKQKKIYNCLPQKGKDPMSSSIEGIEIEGGFVKQGENDAPFSYLVCPESKDGLRCAESTCANFHGYSWFNYPSKYETTDSSKLEYDKYLPPTLCGGEGVCDSTENTGKGICLCNNGFIGSTCQTLDCPSKYCSGHGRCEYHSIDKLGLNVGECECDNGYSGNDCSERTCPKSLDSIVTVEYTFTGDRLSSGKLTMSNSADNSKVYKTWTDVATVTIKDLLTELQKFGEFSYTISGDSTPLTSESLITKITTTDTKLTLTGIKVEDSKNFPKFTLTDTATIPNTLTSEITKSNEFTLTGSSSLSSGKLTMEYNGNILYVWEKAEDVTIGDLLEKLELYLQLKFNTDEVLTTKLSSSNSVILTLEGTTLSNPPETTNDITITLTVDGNTITITKPQDKLPLSWSLCNGYGNCDKKKGQCNCFKNYYGKYCNYKMRN